MCISSRRVLANLSDANRPLHMDGFAAGCNCLVVMSETMKVRHGGNGGNCTWPIVRLAALRQKHSHLCPPAGCARLHEAPDRPFAAGHAPAGQRA